jgi:hypothetical protein
VTRKANIIMPLRVQCPQCAATYNLADSLAGKKFRCKKCQGIVAVPVPAPQEVAEDEDAVMEPKPAARPKMPPPAVRDEDDEPRPAARAAVTTRKPRSSRLARNICNLVVASLLFAVLGAVLIFVTYAIAPRTSKTEKIEDFPGQTGVRTTYAKEPNVVLLCSGAALAGLAGLLALITPLLFLVWLGRTWSAVPPEDGGMSGAMAVLLLFVPVFNLYWMFRVIPGLSGVLTRALEQRDPDSRVSAGGGAGMAACLMYFIPGLNALAVVPLLMWLMAADKALNRLTAIRDASGSDEVADRPKPSRPAQTSPDDEDRPAPAARPRQAAKQSSSVLLWLVLIGFVVLLGVGAAAAFVVFGTDWLSGTSGKTPVAVKKGPATNGQPTGADGTGKQKKDDGTSAAPTVVSEPLLRLPTKDGYYLAFSPDGKWVAYAGIGQNDGAILLDAASGKQHGQCPNNAGFLARTLLFTPDSKSLLVSCGFGRMKKLAVPDGNPEDAYDEGEGLQLFLAFDKEGRLLGGYNPNPTKELIVKDLIADKVLAHHKKAGPGAYGPWVVSPDGTKALVFKGTNVMLVQWTPAFSTKTLETFPPGDVSGTPLSTAGCRTCELVAVSSSAGVKSVNKITFWDVNTGDKKDTWKLTDDERAESMVMSHDGKWLATTARSSPTEQVVCLWSIATKRKVAVLKGMAKSGGALALAADMSRLAALDQGGTLYVWDLPAAALDKQ